MKNPYQDKRLFFIVTRAITETDSILVTLELEDAQKNMHFQPLPDNPVIPDFSLEKVITGIVEGNICFQPQNGRPILIFNSAMVSGTTDGAHANLSKEDASIELKLPQVAEQGKSMTFTVFGLLMHLQAKTISLVR